jgi:tetratricopeptide (TPR) repeat protein
MSLALRSWWRPVLTAVLLAAAAIQLGRSLRVPADFSFYYNSPSSVDAGEMLIHGVALPEGGVSWSMPFSSIPDAVLRHHAPAAVSRWTSAGVLAAAGALVFILGCLLHSPLCGSAAACLYAWTVREGLSPERWLFGLALLLVALAAAWRAREPSPGKDLLLGLAVAASLLVLSSFFLYPFLLLAWEWFRGGRSRGAATVDWGRRAAALLLPGLLLLLPWVWMNWRLHGGLTLFEHGRADSNTIAGALGLVRAVRLAASPREAAGIGVDQSVLLWAAGEVLAHPLRTLIAFIQRVLYVFALHPVLLPACAVSAWFCRGQRGVGALALLTAYFIGAHCLMAVGANYIRPLLPLLCVLLACGLARPLSAQPGFPAGRLAAGALALLLAPLLALQVWALGLAAAYPARSVRPFAEALSRSPSDAWLRLQQGRLLLRAGQAEAAARSCAESLALDPRPDAPLDCVIALGEPAAGLLEGGRFPRHELSALDRDIVKASFALLRKDRSAARSAARRLVAEEEAAHAEVYSDDPGPAWLNATFSRERELEAGLRATAFRNLEGRLKGILERWPAPRRPALLGAWRGLLASEPRLAARIDGASVGMLALAWAEAAAEAGRRDEARRVLDEACRWPVEPRALGRAARLYEALGRPERGLSLLARLARRSPSDAAALLDLAEAARRAGRHTQARAALERAGRLRLDCEDIRRAAGFSLREPGRRLAFLRRAGEACALDSAVLLDWAEAAAGGGRRDESLRALAAARRLDLDEGGLLRAARVYRLARAPELEAEALELAAKRSPGQAEALLGWAGRAIEAGRYAQARRVLGRAAGLDAEQSAFASALRNRLRDDERRGGWRARAEESGRKARALQEQGQHARALELLDRLVRESPGAARPLGDRGVLKLLMGRRAEAEADLRAALAAQPDFSSAVLSLGSLLSSTGRREEALRLYDEALARPAAGDAGGRAVLDRIRAERDSLR